MLGAVRKWREELSASTDLNSTNLQKKYDRNVFKHYQIEHFVDSLDSINNLYEKKIEESSLYIKGNDDCFSPLTPDRYIKVRLLPKKQYYQLRIPTTNRWRVIYQLLIFLSSAISAGKYICILFFNYLYSSYASYILISHLKYKSACFV